MPLTRVPYRSLRALLRRELITEEHAPTAALVRRLAPIKARGRFTRAEFLLMCRWKSPRARRHYERNTPVQIRRASAAALAAPTERKRIEHLTALHGVSVATASAILTLIDPRRYGVLDIRAWQLLFAVRSVADNARGQGFTIAQWERYLAALRAHARRLGVSARTVEYTLFEIHRRWQRGTLYASSPTKRAIRRRRRSARPRAGT